MGLNVVVETLDRQPHPEWDDSRYAGDRSLFDIANQVTRVDRVLDPGFGGANDWYRCPVDFAEFRAAAWPAENPDRWAPLAQILERDTDFWVYLSV